MVWLDTLVEQPVVAPHHVLHRAGMDVLGLPLVMDNERAAADGFCDMGVGLAVRVHRADHVSAAMRAQQHAVLSAAFGHYPHGGNSSGIASPRRADVWPPRTRTFSLAPASPRRLKRCCVRPLRRRAPPPDMGEVPSSYPTPLAPRAEDRHTRQQNLEQ